MITYPISSNFSKQDFLSHVFSSTLFLLGVWITCVILWTISCLLHFKDTLKAFDYFRKKQQKCMKKCFSICKKSIYILKVYSIHYTLKWNTFSIFDSISFLWNFVFLFNKRHVLLDFKTSTLKIIEKPHSVLLPDLLFLSCNNKF